MTGNPPTRQPSDRELSSVLFRLSLVHYIAEEKNSDQDEQWTESAMQQMCLGRCYY